jgi:hypothetical protein
MNPHIHTYTGCGTSIISKGSLVSLAVGVVGTTVKTVDKYEHPDGTSTETVTCQKSITGFEFDPDRTRTKDMPDQMYNAAIKILQQRLINKRSPFNSNSGNDI